MAPNLSADNLFRVDGMVAVITGGGTGKFSSDIPDPTACT
jgi:hypothetical protein